MKTWSALVLGLALVVLGPSVAAADSSLPACPATYEELSETQRAGEYSCDCTEARGKAVGTGIYAADSAICVAAIHSGAIDNQGRKTEVTVMPAPGCTTYAGSSANGVDSITWGKYGASFYFPATHDGKCVEVELPKADMKNAKLEKAVAAAYKRDYTNKVLMVILHGWLDEFETDDFGRIVGRDMAATVVTKLDDGSCELHYELWVQNGNGRKFSGPLSARGAGSKETTPIGCEKVEKASAGKKGAKKKKKKK